ncbi:MULTISPECIES: hypothetical protein [Halorussus]|uniref:hypothetical protein n=1 Tax=Halorussus TaxID=1070314 RepID=UPI0013B3FA30|nr:MULTISPECIES: hypothetical protein [Halorussus]NHN59826.1 hypothetical protein [Halorussus sp. JP-T4]
MTRTTSGAATMLAVLLLVAAPIVGAASVSAQQVTAPDGYVGVPDTNIVEDVPVGADVGLEAHDLEGSVMASDYASSLQVIVTTPERAGQYVGTKISGAGNVALVVKDDTNHDGRKVALPADAVRTALGYKPRVVYGRHEDGERWASNVTGRNGLLIFEVPKFSSNAVTFSGRVEQTFSPATDGTESTYELGSYDAASDPNVTFEGWTATEWDNVSGTSLGDGDTLAVNPAGNTDLRGPNGSKPEIVFTGDGFMRWDNKSVSDVSASSSQSISVEGNLDPTGLSANGKPTLQVTAPSNFSHFGSKTQGWAMIGDDGGTEIESEIRMDSGPATIDEIYFEDLSPSGASGTIDVYIEEDSPDGYYGEGTLVKQNWDMSGSVIDIQDYSPSSYPITVELVSKNFDTDESYTVWNDGNDESGTVYTTSLGESGSAHVELGLSPPKAKNIYASADGASASFGTLDYGETVTKEFGLSSSASSIDWSGSGIIQDWTLKMKERKATEDPAVDLDGDGVDDITYSGLLSDGETVAYQASELSLSDDSLTVSTASSSTVDVGVRLQEVTQTRNPTLTLNNQTVASYSGVLADGATVERTVDKTHLREGQNNLSVSVGDGSLTADAPTPSVGLNVTHDADVKVTSSYAADGWKESYNVSHQYAGDRSEATVTVPFSRHVYDVQNLEYRVNGGEWTTVSEANWNLVEHTTLKISPPDPDGTPGYEAGDELAVRTSGFKVKVVDGEITVTDPTDPGDDGLNTEFRVDNRSVGFHLGVGTSANGDRVHYLKEETWENPDEKAVLTADGSQEIYLPNAKAGGSARVSTIPVEVGLSSGDVGFKVQAPEKPRFEVTPGRTGSGTDVTYKWFGGSVGETYGIYSVDQSRFLDKAEFSGSYVELYDDDSSDVLAIKTATEDSGSSSDNSGDSEVAGGSWDESTPDGTLQQLAVLGAWVALVIVLIGATGRSNLEGRRRWAVVGAVGLGSGLGALEILRPGSVSGAINVGLQEVVPLAGLAAIGVVVYSVVTWWQSRKAEASTPETKVTLDLGKGGGD